MTEQTTALTNAQQIGLDLDNRADRLNALLTGSDITPEKFIGMTIQAIARDRKLLAPNIDRESLLMAVLSVAEMGLAPTGAFGGAWLIPFGNKIQPIVDWRGFIKMAFRSGQLRGAWAYPVYSDDDFRVTYGTAPRVEHNPSLDHNLEATVTHVYAVAHLTTGERVFEVMTRAEVEAIRQTSRAKDSGPWVDNWLEMARKTVIRRLFKYLPVAITPQMAKALESEDDWEDAGPPVTVSEATDRRRSVVARLAGASGQPDPEPDAEPAATAAIDSGPTIGGAPVDPATERTPTDG